MALKLSEDTKKIIVELPMIVDKFETSFFKPNNKSLVFKTYSTRDEISLEVKPEELKHLNGFIGKPLKAVITIEAL